MKTKNFLLIIIFLILTTLVINTLLKTAAAQPIPQNNIPDSLNVSLIGRWANGPCLAVAVNATGTITCFGDGSYLEIVDISNPANPVELSKILLPAHILDVVISGSYAYVANAGAGLRIIDISSSSGPKAIAYWETLGIASGLAIDGTKIYIADGDRGLLPVDISIPNQPKEHKPLDTDGWAEKVAVNGSFAYIADKGGGLKVIDISDPSDLKLVGSYTAADAVLDVAINGTYAYLAAGSAGLRVLDISNPYNNPSEIGSLDAYQFANAITIAGTRAYLVDKELGLRIIDISVPNNPKELGSYKTEGNPQDVFLSANNALLADGHNGMRVIDVSDFYHPSEIGFFNTDGSSRGVAVDDNYAYLVKWDAGLRVIDISDPAKLSKIETLNLMKWAEDIVINGDYGYFTNYENGLRIINIADPSELIEDGFITQNINAKRVAIQGDYAYVADTTLGLHIVDIINPAQPNLLSSLPFPGKRAEAIAIKENYAYLAAGDDGLIIVDIANPSQPSQVSSRNLGGTAISIDVDENLAYVGTLQKDLNVVNISVPAQPIIVSKLNFYSPLYELVVEARYLYVANGASGLRVIDVIYPSTPTEVGFYITGGTAYGLTLDENYIYLSCAETGLFILEFSLVLDNKAPLAPTLISPANKIFIKDVMPQFSWQIPADENNDPLHFKIELDRDAVWSDIDYEFDSQKNTTAFSPIPPVAPSSGSMNYSTQSPVSENSWYWRVAAFDGLVYGQFSDTWSFTVDTTAPVLKRFTFENPGYGENWFNPKRDTSVTLVLSYDELYPEISNLIGSILPDTLYRISLLGGINQEARFIFGINNQLDGNYALQASIRDSAGNTGSKAGLIQLDSTPPFGYFTDAPDTIAEGQNYIVHVVGVSDSLGCGVAQIYLDAFTDIARIPTTTQNSIIGKNDPGIYYYRYFAEDNLGNRGEIKTDTTVVTPIYPQAPIFPVPKLAEVKAGDNFWIDIQVGTEQQPVKNLFDVNFILNYSNTQYIDVASQDSVLLGDFFSKDATLNYQIDDQKGEISFNIARTAGTSNIDGYGTIARIKYDSDPNTADRTAIDFKILSVTAYDSAGYSIELIPRDTTIWIIRPYADFTMTIQPEGQTIHQSDSAEFLISFEPLGVFDSPITLSIHELPDGMQAIFETQPFEIPVTDTITFAISQELMPGIYYPIINASGNDITHADTISIKVLPKSITPDFIMMVQPDSQIIYQSENADFAVSLMPIGGFNSKISLAISNLPEDISANYSSEPFSIPDSFNVKFSTTADISPGRYEPIIFATGAGITHIDTVTIIVLAKPIPSDFVMTVVPDSQTIHQGESTNFTAIFQTIGEFDALISLLISNLPEGMAANYPSVPFPIPDSIEVTFSTNADIFPGTYRMNFTATGGGITHLDTVTITVLTKPIPPNFVMSVVPDSSTIYQGESTEFAASFKPTGEFNSQINLEILNLPEGMTANYPSEPFSIPDSFNVTFSTVSDILPGIYEIIFIAAGDGITHSKTVTINVLPKSVLYDFSMTLMPENQSIHQGESAELTLSFQKIGEFNSKISLIISNLPVKMDAKFPSESFACDTSFKVTFSTITDIAPGTYKPFITAIGGGITHQDTVAINVILKPRTIQEVTVLPNPFTPNDDGYNDFAEFLIPENMEGNIAISIFDINGRKITEIQNSRVWYGKDDRGRDVKPGAYIYIVKNGEKVASKGVISLAR